MIHQLIFASPKPGMSEADFQRYWVEVHAVRFASKIPQIKRYLIDTRLALPGEQGDPVFSGIAEIWLEDERAQLASLQSKEFLEGARRDEPNWAAFWKTLALDTQTHELHPGPEQGGAARVKLVTLFKRAPGVRLPDFRASFLGEYAPRVRELPGLSRYVQCHARDALYVIGESRFDCAEMLWFEDLEALQGAQASRQWRAALACRSPLVEHRYTLPMLAREHWIIGPTPR